MTTLSTHDTKRGEDVRARIGVLSQVPSLWTEFISRWENVVPSPDPATGLFLWQNIFGVWPADGEVTDELRDRLHAYAEKAIREAAWHTSWNDPDTDFEGAVHSWLDDVLDGPVVRELTNLVVRLDVARRERRSGPEAAVADRRPGSPTCIRAPSCGTTAWSIPTTGARWTTPPAVTALKSLQHSKIRVVKAALQLRRARPDTFLRGDYHPVLGRRSRRGSPGGVPARRRRAGRGDPLDGATSSESGWGDTAVTLPDGSWTNALTGAVVSGTLPAAELFAELPVALLERADA